MAAMLLILPALYGKGRLLRFIFANPIMIVFGRLSFCIYLVHIQLMAYLLENRTYATWFSF